MLLPNILWTRLVEIYALNALALANYKLGEHSESCCRSETFKLIYKIVNSRTKIEKRPKISYNHNPAAKETRQDIGTETHREREREIQQSRQRQMRMQIRMQNEMKLI